MSFLVRCSPSSYGPGYFEAQGIVQTNALQGTNSGEKEKHVEKCRGKRIFVSSQEGNEIYLPPSSVPNVPNGSFRPTQTWFMTILTSQIVEFNWAVEPLFL